MITVEYIRSSAVAMAPMTVGCPRCLAGRGSYCKSTPRRGGVGYQNSAVGFHKARKDAIAHLDEQQRYDAFAEMRAEEAALREQVSRQLAQPLSAQQVESRRRTREAWQQAGREVAAGLQAERRPLSPMGGGKVLDLRPRLAARHGSTPQDIA